MDKIDNLGYYFFNIMAVFMLVTTLLSYVFIKENYRKSEYSSALDIIKIFPGFIKNPNLRKFIYFGFLSRFFIAYWGTVGTMILLELGINKDVISEFSTLSLIVSIIFMIFIGNLSFKDNAKVFKKSYKIYYFFFVA